MEFQAQTFDDRTLHELLDRPGGLTESDFSRCLFKKLDLSGRDLSGASFVDCAFTNCNLSNVKVGGCSFQNVSFTGCKVMGVDFSRISTLLVSWSFKDCNISLCDFRGLGMKNSRFLDCQVGECDFLNVNLADSDFSGSDLRASRFQNANLEKADFTRARNYYVDPTTNRLKHARFSYPEVLALLSGFNIKVE